MSSDGEPVPSQPGTDKLERSFAERLTFPSESNGKPSGINPQASSFTPSKFDWAEEAATPTQEKDIDAEQSDAAGAKAQSAKPADESLGTQKDGASDWLHGTAGLDEPEFDVNVKLADLQDDPNNPLYSVKSFDQLNLREELLQGLSTMNFRKPSKIQERALPLLFMNPPKNLIGQSQSGTGKTAAFTLNILSRVDLASKKPQALVLAPTRELAKQISGVAQIMGSFLEDKGLVVTEAVPDPSMKGKQYEGQVIIGTPGTTMDMIRRRQLDASSIKVLTLDEADNMLDMAGMGDQCIRVKRLLPKNVQTVLFSATFPDKVLNFADQFAPNANKITLQVEELTVKGIKQMYLDCDTDEAKYNALVKFYGIMTVASSIIFVQRRDTAAEIERRMTAEGHSVASLSGALDGAQRDAVFNKFRSGEAKVLITTNVLSRGIDVQTVTMVINYDIPQLPGGTPDYETYLHRIGRTGRFGRTGAALSFVHDKRSWQQLMDICKHFHVEPTRLDTSDWDDVEKSMKAIMKNARNAAAAPGVISGPGNA